jgi:hypothetical protein
LFAFKEIIVRVTHFAQVVMLNSAHLLMKHALTCCLNFAQSFKTCQSSLALGFICPALPTLDDSDPDPGPPLAWNPRIALATLWPPLTARLHYPSLHTPCHGSAPLKTTQQARLTSPGPTRLGCSGPLPRSLPSFMSVCPLNPRARSLPSLPR